MSGIVSIRQSGQQMLVQPDLEELKHFFTQNYVAAKSHEFGITIEPELFWLFEESYFGGVHTGVGLLPLVVEYLKGRGFQVRVTHSPVPALPRRRFRPKKVSPDTELLRLIAQNPRGLIRYFDTGMGRPERVHELNLIRQIVDAWPLCRTLVLCSRGEDVKFLAKHLDSAKAMTGGGSWFQTPRLIVSTYHNACNHAADFNTLDFCLVLDAEKSFSIVPDLVTKQFAEGKPRVPVAPIKSIWFSRLHEHTRVFGFLKASARLSIQQRDQLLMLFGHHVLTIPQHGVIQRRVRPIALDFQHPSKRRTEDVLAMKRRSVWGRKRRNTHIAELVSELLHVDMNKLSSFSGELTTLNATSAARQISILVDSLDHAYHLGQHLPNAVVLTARGLNTTAWTANQRSWLEAATRLPQELDRPIIATRDGLAQVKRCDILINAAANPGPPRIPDSLLSATSPDDELVLIDICDEDGGLLSEWSRIRQEFYDRQPIDSDDPRVALQQFMECRRRDLS